MGQCHTREPRSQLRPYRLLIPFDHRQVIEFYRYFRFLPDGRCLSLRSTDAPSDIVRKIDPSMKLKGFAVGSWQLYPEGLPDDEELQRPPGPKVEITHLFGEYHHALRADAPN